MNVHRHHFFLRSVGIVSLIFLFQFTIFQVAYGATYFSDDFSSDFGELSTHTPTITGTGWTQLIDNGVDLYVQSYNQHINVQANTANAGSFYTADGTYSTADYEITVNEAFSSGGPGYTRSIAVRVQDANNMYLLRFNSSTFELYKRVSGTWSLIGSQSSSFPAGNTSGAPYIGDQVGLKALGNEISASINGSTVLTVTDSSISAAGKAGVGIGYVNIATDDGGTGVGIDNVAVNSVTSDVTAPTVSTLSPVDGATSVAVDTDLVIAFSENVDVESGDIVIYKASDNTMVETIDVTSGQVTGTGSDTITINPTSDLSGGTDYYVQIDAAAFDDASSNSFAGISDSTTWNFRTVGGGSRKKLITPSKPNLLLQKDADSVTVLGSHYDYNTVIDSISFEYWSDDEDDKIVTSFSGGVVSFKDVVRDLECGTEYHFAVAAKNSFATTYSDTQSVIIDECDDAEDQESEEIVEVTTASNRNDLDEDASESATLARTIVDSTEIVSESHEETIDTPTKVMLPFRDLYFYVEGEDVFKLQEILIHEAVGEHASELQRVGPTNFFGRYTENALAEYQLANGIQPAVGYFGPITKSFMESAGLGVWW